MHGSVLLLAILLLGSCELDLGTPGTTTARLAIAKTATAMDSYELTISGTGMDTIEEAYSGNTTSIAIAVPSGMARTFELVATFEPSDTGAVVSYRGIATVDLVPGATADIAMSLAGGILLSSLTFADANFAGAVNSSGRTYVHELTYLGCENCGITDLTGAENLTSLSFLTLSGSGVTDVNSLASLPSFTHLVLDSNGITDLSSFGSLTGLRYLSLSDNPTIADVSPLGSLTGLTHLALNSSGIDDADVISLASLTGLTDLRLNDNIITNVGPLFSLTNIAYLWLRDNAITLGVDSLVTLTSATTIDFTGVGNAGIPVPHLNALDLALGATVVIRL